MIRLDVKFVGGVTGREARAALWKRTRLAVTKDAEMVRTEAQRIMSKKVQKAAYRKANPLTRDKSTDRFQTGGASGGQSTGRSRPGEIPRSDSGSYRKSIRYYVSKRGRFAVVGAAQPGGSHAGILKHGTKFMQPRLVPAEVALKNVMPKLVTVYKNLF